MFRALRSRNYRLFFFGQVVSLCGTWIQSIAMGWLVLRLTNSPFYLGLVSAASSVPVVILSFAGGVLADRADRKKVVLAAQVASMLLSALLAVLTLAGWVNVEQLLIIAVLSGCVNAFEAPARQAFTIEMVGRDDLLNAIALNSTIFNAARTIGPALAGLLVASFGEGIAFGVNALSFVAVIVAISCIEVGALHGQTRSTTGQGVRAAISYIMSVPTIRTLLSIAITVSFFGYSFLPLLPLIVRDVLHSDVRGLGWLSASNGVGALIAALSLAAFGDRWQRGNWLMVSLIGFPCALYFFSQAENLSSAMIGVLMVGFFGVTAMALINTIIQSIVSDQYRGRVMSVFTLSLMGLSPLGGLLAGTLAHSFGDVATVIGLSAILTALAVGVGLGQYRAIR